MALLGLILLPFLSLPTLVFLRKDFQVKLFFSMVSLIHFGYSVGILAKYGYLFDGRVLEQKVSLAETLGFNYSVSASGTDLLLMTLLSSLFLFFGTLSLKNNQKINAIKLMISHGLSLMALFSTNLLLTSLVLFWLLSLLLCTNRKNERLDKQLWFLMSLGLISLVGVCLIFGILFESVFKINNLDIEALSSMKTPFVKGSLYSTQLLLSIIFTGGVACMTCVSLKKWISSVFSRGSFSSTVVLIVVLYASLKFFKPLFPEIYSVYLPWTGGVEAFQWPAILSLVFCTAFGESFEFFNRSE